MDTIHAFHPTLDSTICHHQLIIINEDGRTRERNTTGNLVLSRRGFLNGEGRPAAGGVARSHAGCHRSGEHGRGLGELLPLEEGLDDEEHAVRLVDRHHVPGPAHRHERQALVLDHVPADLHRPVQRRQPLLRSQLERKSKSRGGMLNYLLAVGGPWAPVGGDGEPELLHGLLRRDHGHHAVQVAAASRMVAALVSYSYLSYLNLIVGARNRQGTSRPNLKTQMRMPLLARVLRYGSIDMEGETPNLYRL